MEQSVQSGGKVQSTGMETQTSSGLSNGRVELSKPPKQGDEDPWMERLRVPLRLPAPDSLLRLRKSHVNDFVPMVHFSV